MPIPLPGTNVSLVPAFRYVQAAKAHADEYGKK